LIGREIEADAAEALGVHGVQLRLGGLVVDDGDAARVIAARLHAEQRRRIVGAVDARRHDHDALDVQRLMQRRHLLRRSRLGRVDAAGEERKLFRIAVNVGVAVAGAGRHVEIDRCRGLRRLGAGGCGVHRHSGGERSQQQAAAVQHGDPPRDVARALPPDARCRRRSVDRSGAGGKSEERGWDVHK
jgi:hypothetical protein